MTPITAVATVHYYTVEGVVYLEDVGGKRVRNSKEKVHTAKKRSRKRPPTHHGLSNW